ncbi:MAG TPA: hypothetical protein VEZ15_08805 [Acidimicrobiia bacterium]|nr:hypothetical protein [Acidimicrobiia bacterium]
MGEEAHIGFASRFESWRADPRIASLLDGAAVRKVVVVPGRMVNFVLG